MLDGGDGDGQLVWMRIRRAIVELQASAESRTEPNCEHFSQILETSCASIANLAS
jgi:hypothetical protein